MTAPTGVVTFEAICAHLGVREERRVVLGTGCFDIMHVGHLYFLAQASRQGDILVVGVNSDRSVRAIKGPSRPIVGEWERASLVAALRCVDYVFVYDDNVADSQIRTLCPDVYVASAESVARYPSEPAAALDVGARVHLIDRESEHSTTSVVDLVQRRSWAEKRQAER
jgi:rfaE bifunctional protein nucleotidyltransferase chain/domain